MTGKHISGGTSDITVTEIFLNDNLLHVLNGLFKCN